MIKDVHYSVQIDRRMGLLVLEEDHKGLLELLDSFSHSQFRTAVYMLGEKYAQELPVDAFWRLFTLLVQKDTKAFLVVMLKALAQRMEQGSANIHDEGFKTLCGLMNEVDRQKTINFLLPYLKDDEQIRYLFKCFKMQEAGDWIPFLIKVNTLPCAFLLFSSLRYVEHERDCLVRIAYFLMKRGDGLSFNLASLMKAYFGLDELKGTFSLQLKPFELARLETSYKAFCEKMA
ncbi:MAG: hypothetical protein J6W52_10035 [Bacteroidaceae bacterium]|nr:hypothetical protein [Bacteroidaceae bacterium]